MSGTLYLIPNTLGEGDADALDAVLPAPVRARAASLHYYIGENAKTTRAFLKKVGTERPIQEIEIRELNVNTPAGEIDKLLAPLLAGTGRGPCFRSGLPGGRRPGRAAGAPRARARREGRAVCRAEFDSAGVDGFRAQRAELCVPRLSAGRRHASAPSVCETWNNSRAKASKRRFLSKRPTGIARCSTRCWRRARRPRSFAWRSI